MKHLLLLLVLGSALPVLADEPPYSAPATTVASTSPESYVALSNQMWSNYRAQAAARGNATLATQMAVETQLQMTALLIRQNSALMEQNAKIISLLEIIAAKK